MFSIENERYGKKTYKVVSFLGIKLRFRYRWKELTERVSALEYKADLLCAMPQCEAFLNRPVREKTALLVEINPHAHWETLPGYAAYLRELGYAVDVLVPDRPCDALCRMRAPQINEFFFKEAALPYLLQNEKLKKYEVLFFNSKRCYRHACDVHNCIPALAHGRRKNLYVQHHIDRYAEMPDDAQIVLQNPADVAALRAHVVTPCDFGDIAHPPKHDHTRFICAGELNPDRRDLKILAPAVANLVGAGHTDFKITLVGKGDFPHVSKKLRPYFKLTGVVDFPTLYDEMENSDFYLTLLNPENKAHLRYLKDGVSGGFQLIQGFLKPPIIHKAFAQRYGYSEENSLLYTDRKTFFAALSDAIHMSQRDYQTLVENLKIKTAKMRARSAANLKNLLGA